MEGFKRLELLKSQLDVLDDEIIQIGEKIYSLAFTRLLKEQQALDEITQDPKF